jgi:hypothetical protein
MPSKLALSAILVVLGAGCLVGGVAVISTPAAIVLAGVIFLGFGLLLARRA